MKVILTDKYFVLKHPTKGYFSGMLGSEMFTTYNATYADLGFYTYRFVTRGVAESAKIRHKSKLSKCRIIEVTEKITREYKFKK